MMDRRGFIKCVLWTFAMAAMAVMVVESIHRGSLFAMFGWVARYPTQAFYLFSLFLFGFGVLFVMKQRGFFVGTSFVLILFSVLAFASYTKERLRGDPLLPIDLLMVGEAKNMLQFFSAMSWWTWLFAVAGVILAMGVLIFIFRSLGKGRRTKWHYIIPAISFFLLLLLILVDFSHGNHPASEKENYHENGVVVSFIRNISGVKSEPPEGYSEDGFASLLKEWQPTEAASNRKPHIIMVMSEAFWDPTVMSQVEYNQDPLPNFHGLADQYSSGMLHVPVYGGSTANTEFEVLTGMSQQFLPAGAIAYKSHISKPLPALPQLLKMQGYETSVYHTYHNWFYERNTAYRWLGFDHFVSLEFFPNPVQDMMYYRDNEITDEILKKVKGSEDPQFIYAITMQNHGPYRTDAKKFYATMEAQRKEGALTADAKNILEFYADNLVEVDKELKRLVTELAEMGEDSIVVFFGDHLPLLGDDYQVYKEAGYFQSDQEYDDYMKMYSTPLLVWDPLQNEKEELQMSSPFLGAYLLEKAGLQGYYLTDYLNELRKKDQSLLLRTDFEKFGGLTTDERETYELLQYDLLSGGRQGLALADLQLAENKQYRLGLGDPQIDQVERTVYKGRQALLLKGSYFTTSSQVYINNQAADYTFINENEMVAFVPDKEAVKKVQLKIYDSEDTRLAESNEYKVE
ncbi:LTA synthase family protein [Cytobacillus purgationiresistens]|uniref:Phosphoglycerol transferase MdoB-like AlkP superfamily enzyme n=1 Tax=Cytobacillus purgationiresistens TaxID=863449 RepID=A0ABU0ACX7_9BACI|nr:LTA synthase family protein [Cytobacillus purgationiresistens]MDQ0269112.1 phosphoglycerol transferase MdoB-like AlkP superfamily enzyme [Cytobacillus purgationiresistens]